MEEAASQALAEDPSIFEYDSLYDQMVEEKKKKVQSLSSERKVRTINLCVCVCLFSVKLNVNLCDCAIQHNESLI